MKRLGRLFVWLERLAALAAAVVFLLGFLLWFAARIGALDGIANQRLEVLLKDRPIQVQLGSVRIRPLAATLEARGIRVMERGVKDQTPLASVDRVRVTWADVLRAIRWNAPAALDIEVTGGSLVVSQRTEQLLTESFSFESGSSSANPADLDLRGFPVLSIQDFELDGLSKFGWRAMVTSRFDPHGARFQGQLRLETEQRTIGNLVWDGSVDDQGRIHTRARGQNWNLAGLGDRISAHLGDGWSANGRASAEAVAIFDPARTPPLLALAELNARQLSLGAPARDSNDPSGFGFEVSTAQVRARFEPTRTGHWLDPAAYKIRGELTGRARGTTGPDALPTLEFPIEVDASLFGAAPPGRHGIARVRVPNMPVGPALQKRVVAWTERLELGEVTTHTQDVIDALNLTGEGRLEVVAEYPEREQSEAESGPIAPRILIAFDPSGTTGLTYRGFRTRSGVAHGFPLVGAGARGRFTATIDPAREVTYELGLVDLSIESEVGRVRAEGTLARRPPARRAVKSGVDLDLRLETDGLQIGPQIPEAIRGLQVGFDLDSIAQLDDGTASARVHIRDRTAEPGSRLSVDVGFEGVAGLAHQAPVPFHDGEGDVLLRWTGQTEQLEEGSRRGFGVALRGRALPQAAPDAPLDLSVALRSADPGEARPPGSAGIFALAVDWDDFDLEPDWLRALAEPRPRLSRPADVREMVELEGRGNFTFSLARPKQGAARAERLSVEVREATVTWPDPRVVIDSVGGRILLKDETDLFDRPGSADDKRFLRADLRGLGPDRSRMQAEIRSKGEPEVVAWVSGLDLRGDLMASFGRASEQVLGRVDARIDVDLDEDFAPQLPPGVQAQLRGNKIQLERADREPLNLENFRGQVRIAEGSIYSELIEARHVRTPLVIRGLEVHADPKTRATKVAGNLWVEDLPLDRAHLQPLVDPTALSAWIERLRWRGNLDIRGAHFETDFRPGRPGVFKVSGEFVPTDLFLVIGLPLQLSSARINVQQLIASKSTGVRANGEVSELYGTVAGRSLTGLKSVISYTAGRLSLANLSGEFAGGSVRGLGGDANKGSAIAVETVAPHRFEVALHFERVLVNELLEGLFPSGGSDLGDLGLDLFLEGRRGDLLGLAGNGKLEILGARLYSLPVVRELFALLGLDSTATFDGMSTSFRLADGVIDLIDARATSPLVQLVGGGTLDFDGSLDQEYSLTYSFIDRFGFVSRMFYWVQDRVWRVSIGGDMGRPRVRLYNGLLDLILRPFRKRNRIGLPLPSPQPLEDRF